MTQLGYHLSSEEHGPADLVRHAKLAEDAAFDFALISDHFHPWTDSQGHSPFVWSVVGAIAATTSRIRLGTGVTCPTIRLHPAIVAQAAATAAALMPGRFFLGVGSGENLNEHVLGDRWPNAAVRLEMLEEAMVVMRLLWEGGFKNHRGRYYTVENARIYSLPVEPPPIYVAAAGAKAAALAGKAGDGLIATAPEASTVDAFTGAGGAAKPRLGMVHVCWAADERQARRTAHEIWPNAAIKGELGQELPLPRHFEQAAELVSEDDVADAVVCGPDPDRHAGAVRAYVDAGYDQVSIHQVGPDQEGFLRFWQSELRPRVSA